MDRWMLRSLMFKSPTNGIVQAERGTGLVRSMQDIRGTYVAAFAISAGASRLLGERTDFSCVYAA